MQLLVNIGRKWLSRLALGNLLEFDNQLFEIGGRDLSIALDSGLLFVLLDQLFKVPGVRVQHNFAEHLDKAAVGIVGEALVTRQCHQTLYRFVIYAQVQHGVHHAGHRELGARAH